MKEIGNRNNDPFKGYSESLDPKYTSNVLTNVEQPFLPSTESKDDVIPINEHTKDLKTVYHRHMGRLFPSLKPNVDKKKKRIEKAICKCCGKEFEREIKHNIKQYCSKSCYMKK